MFSVASPHFWECGFRLPACGFRLMIAATILTVLRVSEVATLASAACLERDSVEGVGYLFRIECEARRVQLCLIQENYHHNTYIPHTISLLHSFVKLRSFVWSF